MAGVILATYFGVGRSWLEAATIRAAAENIGLAKPTVYLAFELYFTFVNAPIEQYLWRWFADQKCAVLCVGKLAVRLAVKLAVCMAALCFTLHHVVALAGFTGSVPVTAIGSAGMFVAGALRSWCFLRFQSLWACYVSHTLADAAIAFIGWDLDLRFALPSSASLLVSPT